MAETKASISHDRGRVSQKAKAIGTSPALRKVCIMVKGQHREERNKAERTCNAAHGYLPSFRCNIT